MGFSQLVSRDEFEIVKAIADDVLMTFSISKKIVKLVRSRFNSIREYMLHEIDIKTSSC